MNITRTNYESYFTDYLDGNLSPQQIRELRAFLLLHDDLAEILEETSRQPLKIPTFQYNKKELLKKDELHACADYYPIAIAENSLTPADRQFLKRHPIFYKTADFYRKIKLSPDDTLLYQHKRKLYRKNRHLSVFYKFSVAAVLTLLIGIAFLFRQSTPQTDPPLRKYSRLLEVPPPRLVLSAETKLISAIPAILPRHLSKKGSVSPDSPGKSASVISVIPQPITKLSLPVKNYSLSSGKQPDFIQQGPELQLTENAKTWKPSVNSILAENIFTSMIHTGKILAEKIKNNE